MKGEVGRGGGGEGQSGDRGRLTDRTTDRPSIVRAKGRELKR